MAGCCDRRRAGVKLRFSETTPESLTETAQEMLGKEVSYAEVPVDGARKAAEAMGRFL